MSATLPSAGTWTSIAVLLDLGLLTSSVTGTDLGASPGGPAGAEPPESALISRIHSKQVEVHFETPDLASVRAVELWYTLDRAASWQRFEFDAVQRHSPLTFIAPQEGLYGLFVIISNQAGASSEPPTPGTPPQQWCFVDWTPPLLQLHVAKKDEAFETTRRIALRWTAYDAHLLTRPVDVYYMVQGQRMWVPIELHLPNSGRYDWRVPDQLGGRIMLKLAVSDQSGQVVERFSERLKIDPVITRSANEPAQVAPVLVAPRAAANRALAARSTSDLAALPRSRPSTRPTARSTRGPTTASGPARPAPNRPVTTSQSPHPPALPPASPWSPPERRVIARGPASGRPPRTSSERPAPSQFRTMASAQSAAPRYRPTTIAAAIAEARPAGPEAGSPAGQAGQASVIDTARALRLYRAGTYYRLRGLHGQRGDLAVAALRFRESLQADPALDNARQDLAGVLLLQGKHTDAAEVYAELLARSPDHHGALQGLALTMVHTRQYQAAKGALMRLVALRPNDGQAWLHLGDVCHKMGDLRGARDYWSRAATAQPTPTDLVDKARRRLATYIPLPLTHP